MQLGKLRWQLSGGKAGIGLEKADLCCAASLLHLSGIMWDDMVPYLDLPHWALAGSALHGDHVETVTT